MFQRKKNKKGGNSGMGKKAARTNVPGTHFDSDELRARVTYADQTIYSFTATAGTANTVVYGANCCKNANVTQSSGEPQGWAGLSNRFGFYVVLSSHIRWRITQQPGGQACGNLGTLGAAPTTSALVSGVLYPKASTGSAATTVLDAAAQLYATKRFDWPAEFKTTDAYPSLTNPRTVWEGTKSISIQKLEGEENLRQSAYEQSVNSFSGSRCDWVFLLQDLYSDTAYKGVFLFEVNITYDVLFFRRLLVSDSLLRRPLGAAQMSLVQFQIGQETKAERKEEEEMVVLPDSSSLPSFLRTLPPDQALVRWKSILAHEREREYNAKYSQKAKQGVG
jgi:hypothetical protein